MFVTLSYAFAASISLATKSVLQGYALPKIRQEFLLTSIEESFNSRLKAEGDETSTNLYVSNLPRDMTEGVSSPLKMCFISCSES